MSQDPNAAVVTREHRLAVAQCEGYAHLVHPGNEQHWAVVFVENGSPPGHNERWHALAQAIADAEARARTESQAELARLRAEVLRLEGELLRVRRTLIGVHAPCKACGDSIEKCCAEMCCVGCNHATAGAPR